MRARVSKSGRSAARIVSFILAALVVMVVVREITLSPTPRSNGEQSPQDTEKLQSSGPDYDYPDAFALHTDYLEQFEVVSHTIGSGDNLYRIFDRYDLPGAEVTEGRRECEEFCRLERLVPKERLDIYIEKGERRPAKLIYSSSDGAVHAFYNGPGGWRSNRVESSPITIVRRAEGTVRGSLYNSCTRSGLPAGLVMSMADVFECQVDFATDLRAGDDFKVYFEYAVKGGRRAGKGRILAAELTVNGQSHRAYYYSYPEGGGAYYDDKGRSMARRFLRAPLNYRRISSSFSYKRFHPILKIYRPHLGIDYAAPTGTPVSAIGSGKVSYVGWKGGYGRYVEIRHDRTYKSTYAHLSRYANGVRAGSRVTKGQVIGYVGSSGLSTGPHLDFRFYKNGKAINFLKTKFPHSKSIPESEVPDFEKVRKQYIAVLEGNRMVLSSKGEGLR